MSSHAAIDASDGLDCASDAHENADREPAVLKSSIAGTPVDALDASIGPQAAAHVRDAVRDFDMTFSVVDPSNKINAHIHISAPVNVDFGRASIEVVDAEFNKVENKDKVLAQIRSGSFIANDVAHDDAMIGGHFALHDDIKKPAKRARTDDV